jgi:polyphosphate kinase
MTLQAPFTQPASDRLAVRRSGREGGLVATIEGLLAAARRPDAPLLRRLRLVAAVARRSDALFELHARELRARESGERGAAARAGLLALLAETQAVFAAELVPALRARGIALRGWAELGAGEQRVLARSFRDDVSPLLTPLTVDATHPFPCVATLAPCLAVLVRMPRGAGERTVGIELPPAVPRFVSAQPGGALVAIEEVIGAELASLLPGLDVVCRHGFRVTRDGRPLRSRALGGGAGQRTRSAVRLEVAAGAPAGLRERLARGLGLDPASDVDEAADPLDLAAAAGQLASRCLAAGGAREPA